jgi:hypothetical protein
MRCTVPRAVKHNKQKKPKLLTKEKIVLVFSSVVPHSPVITRIQVDNEKYYSSSIFSSTWHQEDLKPTKSPSIPPFRLGLQKDFVLDFTQKKNAHTTIAQQPSSWTNNLTTSEVICQVLNISPQVRVNNQLSPSSHYGSESHFKEQRPPCN